MSEMLETLGSVGVVVTPTRGGHATNGRTAAVVSAADGGSGKAYTRVRLRHNVAELAGLKDGDRVTLAVVGPVLVVARSERGYVLRETGSGAGGSLATQTGRWLGLPAGVAGEEDVWVDPEAGAVIVVCRWRPTVGPCGWVGDLVEGAGSGGAEDEPEAGQQPLGLA